MPKSAAYKIHLAKVRRLIEEGWREDEIYPIAGITIMARDGQRLTVLKNGVIRSGNHPPR